MPAPSGAFEHAAGARWKISKIGLPNGFGRKVRMDIDRYVELHGRRQQTIIARVIEEAALGRAVDERTDKTKVPNRTNELDNRGIRALHWQYGEPRKTFGVTVDGCRQMVVHRPRNPDTIGAGHEIGAGAAVGEHLHGDAGLIHGLQAPLAN